MDTIRILIADDHPLVRKGLVAMLTSAPEFEVVGQAATGREAVELALSHHPQVVLMDLHMPDKTGIEATQEIHAIAPDIRILIITLVEDDDSVFLALRAGAHGYVLKDADEAEILHAIHAVASGGALFSSSVAGRVLQFFSSGAGEREPVFPALTNREREILDLIAQGYPNPRIAQALHLSTKTVGNYVSSIFSKLQVEDRAEAIIRAREAGMGRTGE